MDNKIILPFTIKSGGNKKSFKILNEKEINKKIKKTNIVNFVKKMIFKNEQNKENKVKFIKASDTKNYYKEIKKK